MSTIKNNTLEARKIVWLKNIKSINILHRIMEQFTFHV